MKKNKLGINIDYRVEGKQEQFGCAVTPSATYNPVDGSTSYEVSMFGKLVDIKNATLLYKFLGRTISYLEELKESGEH